MGEHGTWSDFLDALPGWRNLNRYAETQLGRHKPLLGVFNETHFSLTHVVWTLLVLVLVTWGCLSFYRSVNKKDGILPAPRFGFRAFLEMVADATFATMSDIMGEKNARRFLPL